MTGQPAMAWASLHKRAVGECFREVLANLWAREPAGLADQLTILYDGALITSVLRPESNALELAREMAHRSVVGSAMTCSTTAWSRGHSSASTIPV